MSIVLVGFFQFCPDACRLLKVSFTHPTPHQKKNLACLPFYVLNILKHLREMVKDREAWHTTVHGVAKNRTQMSD